MRSTYRKQLMSASAVSALRSDVGELPVTFNTCSTIEIK